jgi:hypothetical protein
MEKRAEQTLFWQCFFLQFCDVAKVAINNVFRKNGNIQSDYVLITLKKEPKNLCSKHGFIFPNSSSRFTN